MTRLLPVLEIRGPKGEAFDYEMVTDRVTIGRFAQFNDVGLEPDPQQLITRKAHCVIERRTDTWWVIDNGSVNRTFICDSGQMNVVTGQAPIRDGDSIRILGLLTEDGDAVYWELTFRDPLKTSPVVSGPQIAYLEYDWIQAKLFRIEGAYRHEIYSLRPQEHKLIRYMDQRNRANRNVPVMCTYEELITAIWGDEINHAEAEVNHLIYELRQKLEPDPRTPQFLQSVRGLGYRLETHPLS